MVSIDKQLVGKNQRRFEREEQQFAHTKRPIGERISQYEELVRQREERKHVFG